jgi:hypothetical protein
MEVACTIAEIDVIFSYLGTQYVIARPAQANVSGERAASESLLVSWLVFLLPLVQLAPIFHHISRGYPTYSIGDTCGVWA